MEIHALQTRGWTISASAQLTGTVHTISTHSAARGTAIPEPTTSTVAANAGAGHTSTSTSAAAPAATSKPKPGRHCVPVRTHSLHPASASRPASPPALSTDQVTPRSGPGRAVLAMKKIGGPDALDDAQSETRGVPDGRRPRSGAPVGDEGVRVAVGSAPQHRDEPTNSVGCGGSGLRRLPGLPAVVSFPAGR